MPIQMAGETDRETTTLETANALTAESAESTASSPGSGLFSGGSRRVRLIAAAALSLLLALSTAWAFGAFGGSGHHTSPSTTDGVTTSTGTGGTDNGLTSDPSSSASAPNDGTGPAAPSGARAGTSTAQGGVLTPSDGWKTRDSAVLTPGAAMYFIAGTAFGDPSGSQDGHGNITMSSSKLAHLKRGGRSAGAMDQLLQALKAVGGKVDVNRSKTGGGKAAFTLPSGRSIVMNLSGSVQINGHDAFGLRKTSTGWTSTASGPNVRAFLAGFIEGEGSKKGLVGDDPTASHLSFIRALMATPQAYGVRTTLEGTHFFHLYVTSSADFRKVQAYPFLTYVRVPGGQP